MLDRSEVEGEGGYTHALTRSSHSQTENPHSTCRAERESAAVNGPVGLTNKLVQFKKRPLDPCSLKAAYTKNLGEEPLTEGISKHENFTILLYIHKRGFTRKMTEKKRRSLVWCVDLGSSRGRGAQRLPFSCSCWWGVTRSCLRPFLLQPGNTVTVTEMSRTVWSRGEKSNSITVVMRLSTNTPLHFLNKMCTGTFTTIHFP